MDGTQNEHKLKMELRQIKASVRTIFYSLKFRDKYECHPIIKW